MDPMNTRKRRLSVSELESTVKKEKSQISQDHPITPPSEGQAQAYTGTESFRAFNPMHIDPEKFKSRIQEAVDNALSPNFRHYTAVKCLCLSWQEDDLGCIKEVGTLSHVLHVNYGFECEAFQIPSTDATRQLRLKLNEFDLLSKKTELFILYYGGHAAKPGPYDDFTWAANTSLTAPSLDWTPLQSIVEQMPCDALLILDCCYAAHAVRGSIPGKKEVIAASGFDMPALAGVQDQSSFTAFLVHELADRAKLARPFSIGELFGGIIRSQKGPNGKRLARTPVHCLLDCQEPRRPIILYPRAEREESTAVQLATPSPPQLCLAEYPRMVVAVSFDGDFGDSSAEHFERWLTDGLPPEIRRICVSVDMARPSNSTLAILTMPIALWTTLSEHTALRSCGLITGVEKSTPVGCVLAVVASKKWRRISAHGRFTGRWTAQPDSIHPWYDSFAAIQPLVLANTGPGPLSLNPDPMHLDDEAPWATDPRQPSQQIAE